MRIYNRLLWVLSVFMFFIAGIVSLPGLVCGGDVEPPPEAVDGSGNPVSTMKTLDQVEPRIPIPGSTTPISFFNITQSGSYYLTGDRHASGEGISVAANDVTIDLNGFSLVGNSGIDSGIHMNGQSNVEIRNGTVRDFNIGIWEEDTDNGKAHRIINVRVVSNYIGMSIKGSGHLIKDCSASENSSDGIYTLGPMDGGGCTVTGNTAYDNSGDGIVVGDRGSTVLGNTACGNFGHGIWTDSGCTVNENTAKKNGIAGIRASTGCTVANNAVWMNKIGIDAGQASMVIGNTVTYNEEDGIKVFSGSRVVNNMCYSNGYLTGDGAGIHATSDRNYIEGNTVTLNDRGIDVDEDNNIIVKNCARNNTTEYDIVAGNKTGTISTDPTTAGPWDNFDY